MPVSKLKNFCSFMVERLYKYHTPLFAWLKAEEIPKINVRNVLIQHSLLKGINGENINSDIEWKCVFIFTGKILIL